MYNIRIESTVYDIDDLKRDLFEKQHNIRIEVKDPAVIAKATALWPSNDCDELMDPEFEVALYGDSIGIYPKSWDNLMATLDKIDMEYNGELHIAIGKYLGGQKKKYKVEIYKGDIHPIDFFN